MRVVSLFFTALLSIVFLTSAEEKKTVVTEKYAHPIIEIKTEKGSMKFEIYEDKAPNSTANLITLIESGFYKGQSFHRISDGFLVQGGCPNTKPYGSGRFGTGGPGYTIDEEPHEDLKHAYGMLTMAKKRDKGTTGSQFCIFLDEADYLDGKYTVLGKMIEG
ncbi:MAG: peptidylprolyl isomerase, partial [Lentisphaeraceae bacterium]|nr:peptidylprolyl isomerase [Lentisphaeraceae bacterium]